MGYYGFLRIESTNTISKRNLTKKDESNRKNLSDFSIK